MTPLDDHGGHDLGAPQPAPAVKIFVRTLSTPAGLPWEQRRAADLEARHGAPIPIQDVAFQLRRLEPWGPGRPARFAALYVPARAVGERLTASALIDGAPVEVVFLSAAAKARIQRKSLVVAAVAAACVGLAIVASGAAFTRRQAATSVLESLETQTMSRSRSLAAEQRLRDQARALAALSDRGAPLASVLADIAWLSSAKSPDARIEGFHWEAGQMALEAKGDAPPVSSQDARLVERSAKPLRRGVWLWVISTPKRDSGVSAPVVAQPQNGAGR